MEYGSGGKEGVQAAEGVVVGDKALLRVELVADGLGVPKQLPHEVHDAVDNHPCTAQFLRLGLQSTGQICLGWVRAWAGFLQE